MKLAMVVGAVYGGWFLIHFLLYLFILALAVVVFVCILKIGLWRSVKYLFSSMFCVFLLRPFPDAPESLRGIQIPFGVIACVAVSACILLRAVGVATMAV